MRSGIFGTSTFEVEAAAGGEAAAFGFVGGRNVEVEIQGGARESRVDGVDVARVEGRIWSGGKYGDWRFGWGGGWWIGNGGG